MIIFSHHYFELLKESVLIKASIKKLMTSDCQQLSALIFSNTKKRVSETTIKRIYGFALSKFKPSPFTMQALSEYCGYESWEDFCNQAQAPGNKAAETSNWENLCTRTNRVTQITLQALKKRSGIPYDLTLNRKFVKEHFYAFLQSRQPVTLFTSPAGYGKTISLCHLVDELLAQNIDDTCNQNMVLFFTTNSITSVYPNDLNPSNWLSSFLGLRTDLNLLEIFENKQTDPGNFYLIIDGFDEYMFKADQYLILFNQLIDLISFYSKFPWFKVILSMRSSTCLNYRFLVEAKPSLGEKWYPGFMQDEKMTNNMLPFSTDEIIGLSQKINPETKHNTNPSPAVIRQLSHPLFFQLYYQKHADHFTIEKFDLFSSYQLISSYAFTKIYYGINSTEKILLIKALLESINYKNNTFSLEKIKFYDLIKVYNNTYRELLSTDIIKEENFSKYLQYEERISFGNNTLMEYLLARKLYGWNGEQLDMPLIAETEGLLHQSTIKVAVLKWMVFFIISKDAYSQLNYLKDVSLQPFERLEIIIFTCELLQNQFTETKDQAKLKANFRQVEQDRTFSFFLSFQYITPEYEKALFTLLKFELTSRNKILVLTTLATIDIINLNAEKAEKHIREISRIADIDQEDFIINPLHCLNTIFDYFKYGIVQKEALQEITHLCYQDSKLKNMGPEAFKANEIIFKLALLTLKINNNPAKELRFIRTVKKHLEPIGLDYTATVCTFYLSFSARAYLKTGNIKKAIKSQSKLLEIQNSENLVFTPFMKMLFNILSVVGLAENNASTVTLLQVKSLMAYSKKYNFRFAEIYSGICYLKHPCTKNVSSEDLTEIYNTVLKQIRSSGFRLESFLKPAEQLEIENYINRERNVA